MSTLVLLRHGQSDWNAKNLFTGWVDVELTEIGRGRGRARRPAAAGRRRCCRTSCTPRCSVGRSAPPNSRSTACDRQWIPVRRSWRLNERHYGALQGKDKKQTLAEFGEEQFMLLASLVRHPAAAAARRRRVLPGRRPALRGAAAGAAAADGVPEGRRRADAAVLVRRDRPRPAGRARRCWSPRTATRCARWSSTSTASPTTTIAGLNIPTGIPLRYELDADTASGHRRRRVPRPRGGGGRHQGSRHSGPLAR